MQLSKRMLALLLAAVLCAAVLTPSARAAEIYFVAVDDSIPLTLPSSSAPYYSGGTLYAPYTVFNAAPGGVVPSYNAAEQKLVIFRRGARLIFDLAAGTVTDEEKNVTTLSTVSKNGVIYVPFMFCLSHFGLSYSSLTSASGYSILRITTGSEVYENALFVERAENLISYLADQYAQGAAPVTPQPGSDPQPWQILSIKRLRNRVWFQKPSKFFRQRQQRFFLLVQWSRAGLRAQKSVCGILQHIPRRSGVGPQPHAIASDLDHRVREVDSKRRQILIFLLEICSCQDIVCPIAGECAITEIPKTAVPLWKARDVTERQSPAVCTSAAGLDSCRSPDQFHLWVIIIAPLKAYPVQCVHSIRAQSCCRSTKLFLALSPVVFHALTPFQISVTPCLKAPV